MGEIAEGAKADVGREEEDIEAPVAAVLLMITGEEDREAMEDRVDSEVGVLSSNRDLRFNTEDRDMEAREDSEVEVKEDSGVEVKEDSVFKLTSGAEGAGDDMDNKYVLKQI